MFPILTLVRDYWAILVGVGGTLLYLGALHQMVNSNNKAIGRLFRDIEVIKDFKARHESDSNRYDTNMARMQEILIKQSEEWISRISKMEQRIDSIFQLLVKEKK